VMKRALYNFIIMVFVPFLTFAQSTVTGVVKNSAGPLSGVTISEKGGNAVQTDRNGRFSLSLSRNKELIFTSVGYVSQERTVKGGEELEIILQSSSQDINEVVVIGFGTTKKLTNTGAVSSIKGAEIRRSEERRVGKERRT